MTSRELRIKALAAYAEAREYLDLATKFMSRCDEADRLASSIDPTLLFQLRDGEVYSPVLIPGNRVLAKAGADTPIVYAVVYDEDIEQRVQEAKAKAAGKPERPIEPWEGGDE